MNHRVLADGPALPEGLLSAFKATPKATPAETKMAFKAVGSTPDGVIYGFGASAGSVNKLDLDKEFFDKSDLMQMAHDFCASRDRQFKANHKKPIDCDLVESVLGAPIVKDGAKLRTLGADEPFREDMELVGINVSKSQKTHWYVGVKPRDPEVASLAAKGGVAGFSVGVLANRIPVED